MASIYLPTWRAPALRALRVVALGLFATCLGIALCSNSTAGPTQDSVLTNVKCRNPVVVEMSRVGNRWEATLGEKTYPLSLLSSALKDELSSRDTTSVFLFMPSGSIYRDVQRIGVECKKAGAECVNWEVRR